MGTTMMLIRPATSCTMRRSAAGGQVQIYESILGDQGGSPTTGLLTAIGYLKDNRLAPRGFDKRTADKEVAVVGGALDDSDFSGGGDRTQYSVALGDAQGPFQTEVELWYQPVGYRWAENLRRYDTVEPPPVQRLLRCNGAGIGCGAGTRHGQQVTTWPIDNRPQLDKLPHQTAL